MPIEDTLESQRRAKTPFQESTRVGRWFYRLKDLAKRTWRYGYHRSDPENSPIFITNDDLVRLAALCSLLGDIDDPTASALTNVLRDLFFIPGRCRQVMPAIPRIPAEPAALKKLLNVHTLYYEILVESKRSKTFADSRFTPKEIIKVMLDIDDPEIYFNWVMVVSASWKNKLSPVRVFSPLHDRFKESLAGFESARTGTADPNTMEAIERMFDRD